MLYYSIAAMCLHETLDINICSGRIYGPYVRMWRNIAILHIMFLCTKINGGGKICCYIFCSHLVLLSKQKIIFKLPKILYFSLNVTCILIKILIK